MVIVKPKKTKVTKKIKKVTSKVKVTKVPTQKIKMPTPTQKVNSNKVTKLLSLLAAPIIGYTGKKVYDHLKHKTKKKVTQADIGVNVNFDIDEINRLKNDINQLNDSINLINLDKLKLKDQLKELEDHSAELDYMKKELEKHTKKISSLNLNKDKIQDQLNKCEILKTEIDKQLIDIHKELNSCKNGFQNLNNMREHELQILKHSQEELRIMHSYYEKIIQDLKLQNQNTEKVNDKKHKELNDNLKNCKEHNTNLIVFRKNVISFLHKNQGELRKHNLFPDNVNINES